MPNTGEQPGQGVHTRLIGRAPTQITETEEPQKPPPAARHGGHRHLNARIYDLAEAIETCSPAALIFLKTKISNAAGRGR